MKNVKLVGGPMDGKFHTITQGFCGYVFSGQGAYDIPDDRTWITANYLIWKPEENTKSDYKEWSAYQSVDELSSRVNQIKLHLDNMIEFARGEISKRDAEINELRKELDNARATGQ